MSEFIIALMGVFAVCCYSAGQRGREVKHEKDNKNAFRSPKWSKAPFKNKDAKKYDTILENIEIYDGTPEGQKQIKEI